MGIDNRTTMDMDTSIIGIEIDDASIRDILNEILEIDVKDNITFEIDKSKVIKEEDEYRRL